MIKYLYSGYRTAFDGKGKWNFGNDFARNVVIFGVDNSSTSYADNHKNNFLVLSEEVTNGRFGAPEKKFSINFSKVKRKFSLSFHYKGNNICLLTEKKSISLKQIMKM